VINLKTNSKKRKILLALALIIVYGIMITNSHQLMYGINTFSGVDEFNHVSRAFAISNGKVDMYHDYVNKDVCDLYPAGLHVLMSSFILTSGVRNTYILLLLFKTVFIILNILLFFILGSKVHPAIGLLAAFFSFNIPTVLTNIISEYVWIQTSSNYFNTTQITICTLLVSLYAIMELSLFQNKKIMVFSLLLLIASIIHGISHISTYIGYLVCIIPFLLLSMVIAYKKSGRYAAARWIYSLFIVLLSLPFVFFIYYYPMMSELLSPGYRITDLFPPFMQSFPQSMFPISMLLVGGLSLIIIIFSYQFIKGKEGTHFDYFCTKRKYPLLVLYLLLYLGMVVALNLSPEKYIIGSVFPTKFAMYIPRWHVTLVTISSFLFGIFSFFFSVIGLNAMLSPDRDRKWKYIGMLYLCSFTIWFIFLIPYQYYAHRVGRFYQLILPFIFASAIFYIERIDFPKIKGVSKILRSIVVIVMILCIFISTNWISQINKDPPIIEPSKKSALPLRFGEEHLPIITPKFGDVVRTYAENKVVLGSRDTLRALTAVSGVDPPPGAFYITYVTWDYSNYKWDSYCNAIRGYRMDEFFKENNVSYVILGIGDRGMSYIYDDNPNLFKIYESEYGEKIYAYADSM